MAARNLWSALKAALNGWWQDNLSRMGAALAYYTLFAIAPVLFLIITVGSLVLSHEVVHAAVMGRLQHLVGQVGSQTIDVAFSFVVITFLFTLIYRVMPDTTVGWREARVGAIVTALLFSVGKSLLGLYMAASSITTGYGVAGSAIVVLVWVYYTSQIVLLGAEFTKAYQRGPGEQSH